jgi:hypothetical protein
MDGSEKMPLLLIQKLEKLRCFKHVKALPGTYRQNISAWITPLFHGVPIIFGKHNGSQKLENPVVIAPVCHHFLNGILAYQNQLSETSGK